MRYTIAIALFALPFYLTLSTMPADASELYPAQLKEFCRKAADTGEKITEMRIAGIPRTVPRGQIRGMSMPFWMEAYFNEVIAKTYNAPIGTLTQEFNAGERDGSIYYWCIRNAGVRFALVP